MAIAYESDGGTVFAASANNNAITVTLPATRPVGSVLYFVGFSRLITDVVGTAPSGYTLLNTFTSGTASGGRIWVYAKEVVGGESAPTFACTSAVTGNSGDLWGACIYCFSGVDLSGGISAIHDGTPTTTDASGTTTCTYPTSASNSKVGNQIVRFLARFRDAADTFTPTASPLHDEHEDASSTVRTGAQHHFQGRTTTATGTQASVTVAPSNTTAARYLAVTALLKAAPTVFSRSAAIDATGAIATAATTSGLRARFAADAIVGLSDGDPVATWEDSSAQNNDATEATNRPTYQTNEINGLPVVRFDGTDDKLTASGLINNQTEWTIFVVVRNVTVTAGDGVLGFHSTFSVGQGAANFQYRNNQAAAAVTIPGTPGTDAHLITIKISSSSSADAYFDGGSATNFDPSDTYTAGSDAFDLGVRGTAFGNVDIAEVLVFNVALADADRESYRDDLISKYAIGVTVYTASAAISATADLASSATFFSTLSRSAAIDATATIASVPQRRLHRQTALGATATIASDGHGVLSRSSAIGAVAGIASSGTFWSTFSRSASIDAAATIQASAVFWSTFERASALSATALIASAGARVASRSAALSAVGAISSDGHGILSRSASLTATGTVTAAGTAFSVLERSASLTATASIATAGTVTPGAVTHERSASLTVAGTIATSATFISILERSASLTATAGIATTPRRVLHRSALVAATAAISSAPQRRLQRSVSLGAVADISSRPEISGIVTRSAAISATASISSTPQRQLRRSAALGAAASVEAAGYTRRERSASLGAVGGISARPQRALSRAAALTASGSIASDGISVLRRSALISALGTIATSGDIVGAITRSASISATAGISTAHQRALRRSALLSASGTIATAHRRVLYRRASLDAVGGIASSSSVGAVIEAAAHLVASGNISAAGRILEEIERSASLSAVAIISSVGMSESGRWTADTDERWPPDDDDRWPGDSDGRWAEDTDDRWLVSAESNW
jgi:hypothetical protein